MYTVTEEIKVYLEKDDILKFVGDYVGEDAIYRLGKEVPDEFEGDFDHVEWTKNGEIIVVLK
jgi:hypothetical protein